MLMREGTLRGAPTLKGVLAPTTHSSPSNGSGLNADSLRACNVCASAACSSEAGVPAEAMQRR